MSNPFRLLAAAFSIMALFFACHLTGNPGTMQYFSFPTLKDSIKTADSVLIILKAANGQPIDTLFNDKVTTVTQFTELKAAHYKGGSVLIYIEAKKDGKPIYKVERGFDPSSGGNVEGTKVVYISPSLAIDFDWADPKLVEGDSTLPPRVKITPTELSNKNYAFSSRNPSLLSIDTNSMRAIGPGKATLIVCLQVDTTRCDSLTVEITAKEGRKIPDSLFLSPDPLALSLGGTDRFNVKVSPASASAEVTWKLISGTAVQIEQDGSLKALGEGTSRIAATSKLNDKASDTATAIVLPVSAPNRPKVEGSILPVNTPTPRWSWTSGGNGGTGTYRFRLDNPDLSSVSPSTDTVFIPPANLTEGPHTLFVQERNAEGNWSQNGNWTIRIDTTAPKAPSVATKETTPTSTMRPTWSWSGDTGNTHRFYRFKLDSEDFRSGATQTIHLSFIPAANLSEGNHTLYVQERDTAGNWSAPGSARIFVDTTRPSAPVVSASSALTNDATPTWTWTTTSSGTITFRYKLDNDDLSTGATTTTTREFTPNNNLPEGPHTLYVQEIDSAGNWSNSGLKLVRIDITRPAPPRIDSTPYSPLNSLQPKFTWKTGLQGMRVYRARVDTVDLNGAPEMSDSSYAPTGNLGEGRHTVYVQERDSAGNWSTSASRILTLTTAIRIGDSTISDQAISQRYLAIGIDSAGEKFVAFHPLSTNPPRSFVKKWDGSSWLPIGDLSPHGNMRWTNSFKLSPYGVPYIALLDSNSKVSVFRYGGIWSGVGNAPLFDATTGEPTISFNRAGTPYVVTRDSERGGKTTVFKLNGISWDTVGPRGFSNGFSLYFTMAVTSDGIPIVAYLDGGSTPAKLRINQFNASNSQWQDLGTFPFASQHTNEFSMLIDRSDSIFIAVRTAETGGQGEVYRYSNANWTKVGASLFGPNVGEAPVIKCDPFGRKYAAFADIVASKVKLKALISGQWIDVGQPINGTAVDFDFDPSGIPYLIVANPDAAGKASVYRTGFGP